MTDNLRETNEKICGTVSEIVYYNSDNGYAVCEIETEDDSVTAVGYMPYISGGESVELSGNWTFHQDYGPQFKVLFYEKTMPSEISDILKYLSGGAIKGIGESTAKKIVDMFGSDTFDVLENKPSELSKISGISKKRAEQIGEEYKKQQGVKNTVMFLQKYGVSPKSAVKVYKRYGSGTIDKIKENPYVLSETVYNIGFKTADRIALMMGFEKNSPVRIEASIRQVLLNASMNGHTYLPKEMLIKNTVSYIQVSYDEAEQSVTNMIFDNRLKNDNTKTGQNIYIPKFYEAEKYVSSKLKSIAKKSGCIENADIESLIENFEKEKNITLAPHQKSAVYCAVKNGATVITGGPGTGKTTIINAIIEIMESLDKKVLLTAPTGRAAKRMSEVCGSEAKTIHRLLESCFSDEEDDMRFTKNADNPLDCDMIIADEMSMVDILLMEALLRATKVSACIVMVGDADQLPSVGPGYVLHDIICSGVIPSVSLTEIFRQAKESAIIVNAHRINRGEYPVTNSKGTDFFLVRRESATDIASSVVDLFMNRLPNAYKLNPLYQIQVLSPTRKGITGVFELNTALQKVINPKRKNKHEKVFKNIIFREGDKVMQIKNNYDIEWTKLDDKNETGLGVYNGDIGYIHSIDLKNEEAVIVFDDRVYIYDFSKFEELDLAYAVTVHKSQGSEFDAVIMPMYPCPPMLSNRNLFYTAVTRAKKLVVLVGREDCICNMTDNINEQTRYSGLLDRLCE